VLMEVGYSEAEIDALFRAGAANGIPKATE
jgi:hypothetical protein